MAWPSFVSPGRDGVAAALTVPSRPAQVWSPYDLPWNDDYDRYDCPTVGAVGRRRTGKSFFGRWYAWHHTHEFDLALAMSHTSGTGFWTKTMGDPYVHSSLRLDLVDDWITRHWRSKEEANRRMFLVLDDVASDRQCVYNDKLDAIAMEGRHNGIWLYMTTQYPLRLSTRMRDNLDVCAMWKMSTQKGAKHCSENFMGPDFDDVGRKDRLYNWTRENHQAFVSRMWDYAIQGDGLFADCAPTDPGVDFFLGGIEQARDCGISRQEYDRLKANGPRQSAAELAARRGRGRKK